VGATGADGRFAPSPTGPLHLGNLRTALLAWLFACSTEARFLVRMEDLDSSRVRPGSEEVQLADRGAPGEEPGEVLAWMARSLGLAAPRETPVPPDLLGHFDPGCLPLEPTVWSPEIRRSL
jgi:hypothetical protein